MDESGERGLLGPVKRWTGADVCGCAQDRPGLACEKSRARKRSKLPMIFFSPFLQSQYRRRGGKGVFSYALMTFSKESFATLPTITEERARASTHKPHQRHPRNRKETDDASAHTHTDTRAGVFGPFLCRGGIHTTRRVVK